MFCDVRHAYGGSSPHESCNSTSTKSGVGWDGNPLEYSFELKGSAKSKSVRFVVDLSELCPADKTNTLSMAATQKVVDALAEKTPGSTTPPTASSRSGSSTLIFPRASSRP